MNEFSIELAAERIDNQRSREYFKEVLTSFIIGNTRSALVMLWSVVVCDLVYKLQELRDVYNDKAATDILREVEELQEKNSASSEWEIKLLNKVKERTKLVEVAEYQSLVHLRDRRHLSAHPVIGSMDILYCPTCEETRAAIRSALEATLLKPAIFAKGIVEEFVNDLAARRDLFPDDESLSLYLSARYFGRLQPEMEKHLFRSLWKFTFQLDNADTNANRSINYRALTLLFGKNPSRFRENIEQDRPRFSKVAEGESLRYLIDFLRHHPYLYDLLTDAARVPLASTAETDISLYATAWFLSPSPSAHVAAVRKRIEEEVETIAPEVWKKFVEDCRGANVLQEAFDCGIIMFIRSRSFDAADKRFVLYIEPYLQEMSRESLEKLIQGIETNRQTFDRGKARLDHPRIRDIFLSRGGTADVLSAYSNFMRSCI
ncbi:MAG TPA: hypothetical protein VH575_04560 [Gemmataceae bacterium]|jgi:hypothetical protein